MSIWLTSIFSSCNVVDYASCPHSQEMMSLLRNGTVMCRSKSQYNLLFVWFIILISGQFNPYFHSRPSSSSLDEDQVLFCKRQQLNFIYKWSIFT